MAPLVTPSWISSAAIDRSIGPLQDAWALLCEHPAAVIDADHHACAIIEAVVILRRHDEHAVARDDVVRLERIAERRAEFARAGLGLLQRLGTPLGAQS